MSQSHPRRGCTYLSGAPLLVAHRGGSKIAPENTLEAFEQAVGWWEADMLEMDVRLTADGEVVVIHDATVDRTTDGTGMVADLSLSEIQALDAGYHFHDPSGVPSFRGRGVAVPRFEDVLTALPHTRINVEPKEPQAHLPGVRSAQTVLELFPRSCQFFNSRFFFKTIPGNSQQNRILPQTTPLSHCNRRVSTIGPPNCP